MPFQSSVLANPAPAFEGGWASANPHTSMLTPSNGDPAQAAYPAWTAGASGVIVGRFAFANLSTGTVTSAHPGIAPGLVRVGFIHRNHPVILPGFLQQSGSSLYQGQEVDIMDAADVWARFAAGGNLQQRVFASYADGSAIAGTAGSAPTGTAFNVTTTNGSPNLTAVAGTLAPGQPITGTGIPANTYIVSSTGTTAVMSANATASGTVSATPTTAFETRWFVDSIAAAGELAKISTRG